MNVGIVEATLRLKDEWTAKLNDSSAQLKKFGDQASAVGRSMTTSFSLPAVAAAGASVVAFAGFDRVMNQVAAVTADGEKNFQALRDAAIEWGAKTQFSAREAGDAMFELGKAGLSSKQQIDAIGPTLQLATAGQLSLADAASLSANVMATFGLSAGEMSQANDILAAAAASATLDVTDLRETLKYVGPLAQATGNDLAFVSAAASMMAGAGIKGSQAGTSLKGALSDLLNPTKATAGALSELGYSMEEISSGQLKLPDVLNRLKDSSDRAGIAMAAFGQYAGAGMIALADQGGTALEELAVKFRATEGDAQRMADATMKGLSGSLETLKGSVETAGIAFGELLAPAVQAAAAVLSKVADVFTNTIIPIFRDMPAPVKIFTGVLAALAVAAGPVIWVIGSMASSIAAIAPFFAAGTVGASVLTGAITLLLGPVGMVAAAVAALGVVWYKWGDDISRVVTSAYTAVKSYLWDKLEPVLTPIMGLLKSVGDMFSAFAGVAGAASESVYGWIVQKVIGAFNTMREVVSSVVDAVSGFIGKIPDGLLPLLGPIGAVVLAFRYWDQIVATVSAVYTAIKSYLLDRFTDIVNGIKSKVESVTNFFTNLKNSIVGAPEVVAPIAAVTQAATDNAAALASAATAAASVAGAVVTIPPAVKPSEEALKAAKDASDKFTASVKSLADELSGAKAQNELKVLTAAIEGLTPKQQAAYLASEKFAEKLAALKEAGATLPPAFAAILRSHETLNKVIPVTTNAYANLANILRTMGTSMKLALPPIPDFPLPVGNDPLGMVTAVNSALIMAGKPTNIQLGLAPVVSTIGSTIKDSLGKAMEGLGGVIVGALQGGGNVFKAAGASIFGTIGTDLGKRLAENLGGTLGKTLGSFAGPLGTIAGSLLGGLADKVMGSLFGSKGRDAVKEFAESMGGFDALRQKMLVLEGGGDALWRTLTQGVGKNNPQQAAAAIKAIEDALAKHDEQMKKSADVAKDSMKKEADAIDAAKAAMQSKVDKLKSEYDSVFNSIKEELENPEYDEAGNRLFGVVEQQGIDRMKAIADQQLQAETELAAAGIKVLDTGTLIRDGLDKLFKDPIEVRFNVTGLPVDGAATGGGATVPGGGGGTRGAGTPGFAGGTGGRLVDFGRETLVRLHGRERVQTEREVNAEGGGGATTTTVLNVDGFNLARIIAPYLPDAVREYGVRL